MPSKNRDCFFPTVHRPPVRPSVRRWWFENDAQGVCLPYHSTWDVLQSFGVFCWGMQRNFMIHALRSVLKLSNTNVALHWIYRPSVRPSARPPVRPPVRPSVRPSVRPPVRPSARPSRGAPVGLPWGPWGSRGGRGTPVGLPWGPWGFLNKHLFSKHKKNFKNF